MGDSSVKTTTANGFSREAVETQLLATLESIGYGFFACDAEWRLVYVNARAERILGIAEDPLGKSCREMLPSLFDAGVEEEYRFVAAGEIRDFDTWFEPSGRWFRQHCFPRAGGGISVYFHDVTDQKRAEAELRASEERYRAVVEDQTEVISRYRPDGTYTFVNEVFCRFFGRSREELLGRGWHPDVFPEDLPLIEEGMRRLSVVNPVVTLENRVYDASGAVRWMQFVNRGIFDDRGRLVEVQSVGRDITVRKRTEEELRRSEERYRILFENAADAIIICDLEARVISVNEQACRQYGYGREEFLRQQISDLDVPEDAVQIPERMAILERDGKAAFKAVHRDARGRILHVDVKVNRILLDGRPSLMSICRDITERTRNEVVLEQARDAAEAASRAKSEFLATMSHEIRTPLHGIMGVVQLMAFTELTDKQQSYLEIIRSSSDTLLSLSNDILDLSRIESGRIELVMRDFSLRGTIGEVARAQLSLVDRKGLSMHVEIGPDVPDGLTGDQLRLKQILLNLLGNAVKFTERGEIRITVAATDRHDDVVQLTIGVADTGIGISPDVLMKIFTPFLQADSSDTRQYGGSGLGLAICSRLTALMGGRIEAESREGSGSTFFVQLPFFVNDTGAERHDRRSSDRVFPRWAGRPLRILVVDDQEINRLVAMEMLQGAGHRVVGADDGQDALEKWTRESFDAILMDIQMPVMNGIEAARAIRERERSTGGHTPIIAVTARVMPEERDHIMREEFDGYTAKPFRIDALLDEIRRCTEKNVL